MTAYREFVRINLPHYTRAGFRPTGAMKMVARDWQHWKRGTARNYAYYLITKTGVKRLVRTKPKKKNPEDLGRVDWMPRKKVWRVIWYRGRQNIPMGDYPTREKAWTRLHELISKRNPEGLYEAFHGSSPARIRKVFYEPPEKGEPLIKWGKISQINYIPEYPSRRANTEFYHRFGDYGDTMKFGKEKPILATNKDGTHLYIIKDKSKFKLGERGIVG